jgi:hypothetical protein
VVSVTPRPRFTPRERIPGTHWVGDWVGPRAGLDTEARDKILSPLPGIEHRSPGHPVRSQTLYWLSYPAPQQILPGDRQPASFASADLSGSERSAPQTVCRRLCLSAITSWWHGLRVAGECIKLNLPNVVVEWLIPLLRIREVSCSYLGPETDYHVWRFSWFSTVRPGKCRDSTLKLGRHCFLPTPFQFTIHLSPLHSTLCSLSKAVPLMLCRP